MIGNVAKLAGDILSPVTDLIDKVTTTDEERQRLKNEIQIAEMKAKEAIMTAELKQDDKYTKRARPTLVYAGLAAMVLNHVIFPWIAFFTGYELPQITLPAEFWMAWGGVTGVYAFQRSVEKIKGGK